MNHTEKTVPVWKKYSLNVSEAAEYYGIGEKRLRPVSYTHLFHRHKGIFISFLMINQMKIIIFPESFELNN